VSGGAIDCCASAWKLSMTAGGSTASFAPTASAFNGEGPFAPDSTRVPSGNQRGVRNGGSNSIGVPDFPSSPNTPADATSENATGVTGVPAATFVHCASATGEHQIPGPVKHSPTNTPKLRRTFLPQKLR
jgi:hypothetical protein